MPSNMKGPRAAPARTSVSLTTPLYPPGFAGTAFFKPQPSPSKPEPPAKPEPETAKGEHGTRTAHPLRVLTSLKSIVELHRTAPGSISSPPPGPPSLSRDLRWRIRQHTLAETIIFVAFILASVTLFSALAGIGCVPKESDRYVSGCGAPGPETSDLSTFQGRMRQTGLEGKATSAEGNEVEQLYLDEEGYFYELVPRGFRSPLRCTTEDLSTQRGTCSRSVAYKPAPTHRPMNKLPSQGWLMKHVYSRRSA